MLESYQVEHNSQNIYYRSIVGAAEAGSRLRLGIRIRTYEPIQQVLVRLWQDQTGERLIPLETRDTQGEQKFYTAWFNLPDYGCLVWYYFIITMESGTYFYGNNAEMLGGVGALSTSAPESYQITIYNKGARTPDWFKNAVMYQIFPDRFARAGDTIVKKKGAVIRTDWTDDPMYLKDPDTKEIIAYDFFGGNLRGVMEKLDYLKDLGISCIYFNPVFESESNHHYDTGDYHKIDPVLGDIEDFRALVTAAEQRGIHIILDGVFSHTGSNSIYFNRQHRCIPVEGVAVLLVVPLPKLPERVRLLVELRDAPERQRDRPRLYGLRYHGQGQCAPSLDERGHSGLASRRDR